MHIPVVRENTAKLLCENVEKFKPAKILEIGTAVGYSGTLMLLTSKKSILVTIDNNVDMSKKAYEMLGNKYV